MALKRPAAAMASRGAAASAAPVKCLKRPAAAKTTSTSSSPNKEKPQRVQKPQRVEQDAVVNQAEQIEEVTKLVAQQMSAQLTSDMKAVTTLMTQKNDREDKIRSRLEIQLEKLREKHAEEREQERKVWEQERKIHEQDRKAKDNEVKQLQSKLNEANLRRGESDGRLEMLSTIYAEQQSLLALASSAPPALADAERNAGALAKTLTAPKMRRHGRPARAQESVAAPSYAEADEKPASQKQLTTPRSAKRDLASLASEAAAEVLEHESAEKSTRTQHRATAQQLKNSTPKAGTTAVTSPGPPRSGRRDSAPQPSPIRDAFFRSTTTGSSSKPGRPVGSLWGLKPVTPQLVGGVENS